MFMNRRELLTSSLMGSAALGEPAAQRGAENEDVVKELRTLNAEVQATRRSALAGDVSYIGLLRDQMAQFIRSTNKWPDFIDVGLGVWFTVYDWHIRFGQPLNVVRLPEGRYGLTFMFTTVVLRQDQSNTYIGMGYDNQR